jgi:cephalosporin-C deacetylase-like acetyl esterase
MMIAIPLLFTLALDPSTFAYDRSRPLAIETLGTRTQDGATVRDITFASTAGGRTAAYLVSPVERGKGPGILFVHWYEPESKDSNRTQFLEQAVDLARGGSTSLLIETMWSDPEWFKKRRREDDYTNSVQQVKELRRALDVLLSMPGVDPGRVAYVGHDFGAMYGAVLSGVDHRVHAWALQAGTTSFSSWFLLGTKLDPTEKQKVIDQLAPLDPVAYIQQAASPVLFQFGRHDPYVPEARAEQFFNAATEPKSRILYDAGHGLNRLAIQDRQAWLKKNLGIH